MEGEGGELLFAIDRGHKLTGAIGLQCKNWNFSASTGEHCLGFESCFVSRDMIEMTAIPRLTEGSDGGDVVFVGEGNDHDAHDMAVITTVQSV